MTVTAERQVAPLLAARGLDLVYATSQGPVVALKDLSLDVMTGEFVSVIGPSGCGKSTFLKIVSGLVSPTGGHITLAGAPVAGTRRDIGFVFQQPNLLPWKSVLDNVLVPARVLGLERTAARERALELLRLVGLIDFAYRYPNELSGGMQQRVGLARGLLHDPSIILMDEPFAALDAMTREVMSMELQRIWMSAQKSVIFITHSIPEAVFLSDRVVVLSRRPGSVADDILVDLPRPRDIDTMAMPAFTELCNKLRRQLRA
jgi:NitT/TauT family transport system ATP-binding protein